jgi:hypothetical protein
MVAQGYASQLAIGGQAFEFVSSSLAKTSEMVLSEGIRGVRYRDKNRAKIQRERVTGSIVLEPSISEMDELFPWCMGGTTAAGVTPFADALVQKTVIVDKVTKVMTYDEVVPARWVIEGSEGGAIRWTIDAEGKAEAEGNSGSFSATAIDFDDSFYVFSEIALTINSITCTPKSFRLTVDNALDTERFLNSLTRDDIPTQDRTVNLECRFPYDTVHEPLYDLASTGVAGSLVLDDGSVSYTFDFVNMKAAESPIEVPGRSEIELVVNFQIFGDTEAAADADKPEFKVTKA